MNLNPQHLNTLGLPEDASEDEITARLETLAANESRLTAAHVFPLTLPHGLDPAKVKARMDQIIAAGTPDRMLAAQFAVDAEIQQAARDAQG